MAESCSSADMICHKCVVCTLDAVAITILHAELLAIWSPYLDQQTRDEEESANNKEYWMELYRHSPKYFLENGPSMLRMNVLTYQYDNTDILVMRCCTCNLEAKSWAFFVETCWNHSLRFGQRYSRIQSCICTSIQDLQAQVQRLTEGCRGNPTCSLRNSLSFFAKCGLHQAQHHLHYLCYWL